MRYLLLLFCPLAFADPFYPPSSAEQAVEKTENIAKNSENPTACPALESARTVAFQGKFSDLTLIGLVKIDDTFSALFLDSKQQLFVLKQGDVLAQAEVQITHIDLKGLQYQQWQNCTPSHLATLKL